MSGRKLKQKRRELPARAPGASCAGPPRDSTAPRPRETPAGAGQLRDEQLTRMVARATCDLLQEARTPERVPELAGGATALAEEMMGQFRRAHRPTLACREGCSLCCRIQVGVTVPEALRVADFVRRSLSLEEQDSLRQRLEALDNATRGQNPDARVAAGMPCAFLVDDRCSVYPVRPLPCRGWNSTDSALCRRAYVDRDGTKVDVFVPEVLTTNSFQLGMAAGLREAGCDGSILDLTPAARIALADPDAAARWLAGERLFNPARVPGGGDVALRG